MGGYVSVPGSSKDVRNDGVTWTTDLSTSSTTFVDVTNASVTTSSLDAGKTYNVCVIAIPGTLTSGTDSAYLNVLINAVDNTGRAMRGNYTGTTFDISNISNWYQITGVTSITAKLQIKSGSGGAVVLYAAGAGISGVSAMTLLVVEQ